MMRLYLHLQDVEFHPTEYKNPGSCSCIRLRGSGPDREEEKVSKKDVMFSGKYVYTPVESSTHVRH